MCGACVYKRLRGVQKIDVLTIGSKYQLHLSIQEIHIDQQKVLLAFDRLKGKMFISTHFLLILCIIIFYNARVQMHDYNSFLLIFTGVVSVSTVQQK